MKLRTRITTALLGVLPLLALPSLFASASSGGNAPAAAGNRYVGSKACKSCHSAADRGDQFGKWQGEKHAKAWETLGTEEAKKVAAEKGIADPQTADACLKCHVTAFGVAEDEIKKGFDIKAGVQCESCHGPGEQHQKARLKAMMDGGDKDAYPEIPADEIHAAPNQDVCKQCHNPESPSYKPFCFHVFEAQIRHLNPKKPRTGPPIGECSCEKCQSAEGCGVPGCKGK